MEKSILVAPSILSADQLRYGEEVLAVEKDGADWIHLDVMDGHFVPPITFGADLVKKIRKVTSLTLDAHLMVQNPEKHIQSFAEAKVDRLTVHVEATTDLKKCLEQIKSFGIKPGVSVKPETDVEKIYDVLDAVELVLIMTVNPGWGGQPFIPESLKKIEKLSQFLSKNNLKKHIEVDGGIKPDTAKMCVTAGADVLVAGSYVYSAKDYAQAIRSLKEC